MAKLYELTEQYDDLASFDLDTDGDFQAFTELANKLDDDTDKKIEAICKIVRNLESDADAYKAEKMKLARRQQVAENKAAALKKYLKFCLEQIGPDVKKRKAGLFSVEIRKTPARLVVKEGFNVAEYMKQEPDNAKIRAALEEGEQIAGASLETGESLRIV